MRATIESFWLWSNSEGVIQVDWRVEPPWTHLDLLGPTPIDSLDRLQISIPALEIRSTLAHWNCRGLTWTICQTWDLDSLEMTWPDRRSWNWLTLTHTKRVEFQADSKQSPNDFTVAPINARKPYWAPVIQRRFTSIWVSPTEIKVSQVCMSESEFSYLSSNQAESVHQSRWFRGNTMQSQLIRSRSKCVQAINPKTSEWYPASSRISMGVHKWKHSKLSFPSCQLPLVTPWIPCETLPDHSENT